MVGQAGEAVAQGVQGGRVGVGPAPGHHPVHGGVAGEQGEQGGVGPGQTQVTAIPSGASSRASASEKLVTNDFDAAYTAMAGMGGSDLPDLEAEFNDVSFGAGTVGMARSQDPNSANSQFFIDLAPATFLDGQYTVVGQLVDGWDVLNQIKKGDANANGAVEAPDYMSKVTIVE